MPILESALGIENAFAIAARQRKHCRADDRAGGLHRRPRRGEDSRRARVALCAAARGQRRAGRGRAGDRFGLRRRRRHGRLAALGERIRARSGFEGMGCMHPAQIPVIHEAFAPTPPEIEKAHARSSRPIEDAQQKGLGVVSLGSKMIDPPVVQRALKLMARGASAMGIRRSLSASKSTGVSQWSAESGVCMAILDEVRTGRRTPRDAWSRRWSMARRRFLTWASASISRADARRRRRSASQPIIPTNGDKRVPDLETALRKCGLRDGMVISTHHHLRDGDRVALMALEAAAKIGVKDLMWFPSASFPSQRAAIDLMEVGRHPPHRRQS